MKKYKHKITGNIAVETNSEKNYKVSEPRHFTIPAWIIENSNDWALVEDPIFITEDDVPIYDGDFYWYSLEKPPYYCLCNKASFGMIISDNIKRFSTEKKCKEYIQHNTPVYSKKQIIDAINKLQASGSDLAGRFIKKELGL